MSEEGIPGTSQSPHISHGRKKLETIGAESRKIIMNVIDCCDEEKKMRRLIHMITQSVSRAATYTGTSKSSVKRIRQFVKKHPGETPKTPGKKRTRTRGKAQLDDFARGIVRRTIEDFYLLQKKRPSLRKLRPILQEKIGWNWCIVALQKVLLSMGFTWKRIMNKRTLLLECADIVDCRSNFLEEMKCLRETSTEIFYLDEWWIDRNLMSGKCWQRNDVSVTPFGTASQRLIIGNVASKNGFVRKAQLQFWAESTEGEYVGQMNTENFEKWFVEKVLLHLPPQSVIVMEAAPYHNRQIEKTPSRYDTKVRMVEWLKNRKIPCDESMRKGVLYSLICANKPSEKLYAVDILAKRYGHTVLRLPPYTYDLNPMELAWIKVKGKISAQNMGEMSCENLMKLADDCLLSVTEDDWKEYCRKVQEIEEDYWMRDSAFEATIDEIIANAVPCCDSEEYENLETDEDYSESDSN